MAVTFHKGRTFDRIPSTDPARADYPMRVARRLAPKTKAWTGPYVRLDQGPDGACVGFGWTHEALATPDRVRPPGYKGTIEQKTAAANNAAFAAYERAKELDSIPGVNYEGTTVDAGAKVMRELGYIKGWRWAQTIDDVRIALQTDGPVVAGTDWLDSMFDPDENGLLTVDGPVVGGHCYCLTGYYTNYKGAGPTFRFRQSWGRGWGVEGDGFIRVADFEQLLANGGEVAQPVGRQLP